MFLDDLEDDDGEARGWPADLQRAAGEHADDDAAEDAGDEAGSRGNAGGDGDAHTEGKGDEEYDDGA